MIKFSQIVQLIKAFAALFLFCATSNSLPVPFKRWKQTKKGIVDRTLQTTQQTPSVLEPAREEYIIPSLVTTTQPKPFNIAALTPPAPQPTMLDTQAQARPVEDVYVAPLAAEDDHNLINAPRPRKDVRPVGATDDSKDKIEINLEKADLLNVLDWYSKLFGVEFLTNDAINPAGPGKVQGNVMSFHTHAPLTKKQAWDLLLNFLSLFGLTLVPITYEGLHPKVFTVMLSKDANKAPLQSFIGVDWKELPDNDAKIRYVYFVGNSTAATLRDVVKDFVSQSATLATYAPLNALIFTDKSDQIRSIMKIVSELDSISAPEAMSVLRLKHANAEDVAQLYGALVATEQDSNKTNATIARILGQKRQPTTVYFPPNTRVIAEKRTNSLIVLGTKDGIEKVERFVLEHVDTELKQPYSPLFVYDLQYANATDIANILNQVTKFANNSPAANFGGVRGGNKFLRPMTFVAEPTGNRILVKAEKEDYLAVRPIIQELDTLQPQVNIEVLIIEVSSLKNQEIGAQIRNKNGQTLGQNINFQTSGLQGPNAGIVVNKNATGANEGSLVANLIQLAQGQTVGSTLISLGSDLVGGVWALFKLLDTYVHSNVVSHPFLSSTNKYTAQVSLGETRRVQTGSVIGSGSANTLADVKANLSVKITPQINATGMINLDIEIAIDNFTNADPTSATISKKGIKTNATIADKEILAIGGLLKDRYADQTSRVPLLGNVPVLGWFFKDKLQSKTKDNLLVFISAEVFLPAKVSGAGAKTLQKATTAKALLDELTHPAEPRDPVFRWFFTDQAKETQKKVDMFVQQKNPCPDLCSIVDDCEHVVDVRSNSNRPAYNPTSDQPAGVQDVQERRVARNRKPSLAQFMSPEESVA